MTVTINTKSLNGNGFAAFIKDSAKKSNPQVFVDIDTMLNCCTANKEISFKQIFSESVVHEILHSVEELFDKTFDEDRIEQAILAVRENE